MRNSVSILFISLPAFVCGCPGPVEEGPSVSDVPCLEPTEWIEHGLLRIRGENSENAGMILITQQTASQRNEDDLDLQVDFIPHDRVYQFEPDSGAFELVENAAWDSASGDVSSRDGGATDDSRFFIPGTVGRPGLFYNGRAVPVAGGTAVRVISAPPFAAVISSSGTRVGSFLGGSSVSGQHYHQLFSEETGKFIGPAVRIGVGGRGVGVVEGRWVANAQFVVYYHLTVDGIGLICVVDVRDAINEINKGNP